MKNLDKYLVDVEIEGTATIKDIDKIEKSFRISLPYDFKQFIEKYNGIEGGVGENTYVQLWTTDDIIIRNKRLEVNEFAPGLIIIGSDGGDTAYAYDTRDQSMPIVEVPFIEMSLDEIRHCANDFFSFLEYLYNK